MPHTVPTKDWHWSLNLDRGGSGTGLLSGQIEGVGASGVTTSFVM